MRKLFVALLIFALSVSACSSKTPEPTTPPQNIAQPTSTLPTTPLPVINVIPTPSTAELSTITGYLKKNPDNPEAVAGAVLFLAEVIPSDNGQPGLAAFDRTSSPRTITDANGRFFFADVPADKGYSLVIDRFYQAFMLTNPKTGGDQIFDPDPGQVFDAGELIYNEIPGNSPVEQ